MLDARSWAVYKLRQLCLSIPVTHVSVSKSNLCALTNISYFRSHTDSKDSTNSSIIKELVTSIRIQMMQNMVNFQVCEILNIFNSLRLKIGGTPQRSWLRHYATSRKVAGSIPDGVIGIFQWHNPSGRTKALRSTQPPTKTSTRNTSWG